MEKLKPSTNYSFNENDLKFVVELAKVGHVHLLSNQVSLITTNDYSEGAAMDFKDSMNEEKCDGLRLPHNWCIEWIGSSKSKLHITFGVKKVVTIILISFFASCVPARRAPYGCPKDVTDVSGDTVPSRILISHHRGQTFGHAIDGYCIYKDSVCTGRHLAVVNKTFIPLKQQYDIWGCIRRVN